MIVKFEDVVFKYANKEIFKDTSFVINDGVTGIIGKNGCGKSSLLKLLSKEQIQDQGVILINESYSFAYLNQDFTNTILLASKYIKEKLPNIEQHEIIKYLNKFNVDDISCSKLSGGQRRKLDLIIVLLSDADCTLLDEPTNHLDNEMIDFLISHIKKFMKNCIIISHDRYFLDQVCNYMIYIKDLKVNIVKGNYTKCMQVKNENKEYQIASDRKISKKLVDAQKWMDQGPKARGTKSKHLIDNYNTLKEHKLYYEEEINNFEFDMQRLGSKTITIKELSFGFKEQLISNFSYDFLKGDKIGVIGKNGSGKSTLLKQILETNSKIDIGETVKIGYFSQHTEFENENSKVIDYVNDISRYIEFNSKVISALKFLELFGFDSSLHNSYISSLSGGQKRRLALVVMLLNKPNFLVLDEPTNDFDTETLELIESMLKKFRGIIIVVSHDRYFLKKITNKLFIFENKKVITNKSGFTDYKKEKVVKKAVKATKIKKKDIKMSYKEKFEYQNIEQEINECEEQIKSIDELILKSQYQEIMELSKKREELETKLAFKTNRWEYLFELDSTL